MEMPVAEIPHKVCRQHTYIGQMADTLWPDVNIKERVCISFRSWDTSKNTKIINPKPL